MSFNFNNQPKAQPTITFYLNLAKYQDERPTVVGMCTNGMLICSPENNSAWLQFANVSGKHGWSPMEAASVDGQRVKLNPEKFWMHLFSCDVLEDVPNVQMKLNLGDIKQATDLYNQGGCLAITVAIEDFTILGEKEYNGTIKLYLQIKPLKLELVPFYGVKIPASAMLAGLQAAVEQDSTSPLAKYKRTAKKQSKRNEAELAKASAPTAEEDALMDL